MSSLNMNFKFAFLSVMVAATTMVAKADNAMNFGVVDKDLVVSSYPKAIAAAEELKSSEDKIRRLIEDSNKQFEQAKAAKKPQAEMEALQKKLQNHIDDEVSKVKKQAENLQLQLETAIDTAIKMEASARKLDAVFVKSAVLIGGFDITNPVMKRLNSTAAATSTATKKPAATSTTSATSSK